jgi:hypothetical protein
MLTQGHGHAVAFPNGRGPQAKGLVDQKWVSDRQSLGKAVISEMTTLRRALAAERSDAEVDEAYFSVIR